MAHQILLKVIEQDAKCNFCSGRRPKGSVMILYYDGDKNWLRSSCLDHPICTIFDSFGFFCNNHEEGLICQCDEIPF